DNGVLSGRSCSKLRLCAPVALGRPTAHLLLNAELVLAWLQVLRFVDHAWFILGVTASLSGVRHEVRRQRAHPSRGQAVMGPSEALTKGCLITAAWHRRMDHFGKLAHRTARERHSTKA